MSVITIEKMKHAAEKRDGKCLSTAYTNAKTKLLWECSKGHRWTALPHNITTYKSWCPECSGRKRRNIADMQVLAKAKNGQCLSTVFKGVDEKIEWQCGDGHRWFTRPDSIRRGTWCPYWVPYDSRV